MTTPKLTLMMAYYNNPTMLAHQYAHWREFSDELKEQIEIVIVDDGSQHRAQDVLRGRDLPPLRIYRIEEDRPWNQNAARNLAAAEAQGSWLFMTDMDHVVPGETLAACVPPALDRRHYYMFWRWDAGTLRPTVDKRGEFKPHPNTFAMAKSTFFAAGGYDERTCGYYGTDSIFRNRQLNKVATPVLMDHKIWRYSSHEIPDASTVGLPRKQGRPEGWRARMIKMLETTPKIPMLSFEWERVV